MNSVAVITPMHSRRPTGIGVAGSAIASLLPDGWTIRDARLDRWFARINDGPLPAPFRMLLRLGLAQVAPWFFPGRPRLLFASHHAPLWRTGRHRLVVYDLIALDRPDQSRSQHWFYRNLLPRILRRAEGGVVISETVRARLLEEFPDLDPARWIVIPAYSPALEADVGPIVDDEARRSGRTVLVVGARYPHKNLGLVIEAIERLASRDPAVACRLVVAGCRRDLWPALSTLEASGRACVLDRADDAQVRELYRTALALVYPSLVEGQGLPPLEAMAYGCPVICSDIPALRETCGATACYVDPHDAEGLAGLLGSWCRGGLAGEAERQRAAAVGTLAAHSRAALGAQWSALLEGSWS